MRLSTQRMRNANAKHAAAMASAARSYISGVLAPTDGSRARALRG